MRRDSLEVVGLPGQAVPAKKAPQLESCSVDGGGGVTLVNRYTDAELTSCSASTDRSVAYTMAEYDLTYTSWVYDL